MPTFFFNIQICRLAQAASESCGCLQLGATFPMAPPKVLGFLRRCENAVRRAATVERVDGGCA
jgi:hypothetical protein